jgi:hypothetical protein
VTFPSPSQRAAELGSRDARRLAAEASVIWRDAAARDLPWLRERFINRRSDAPELLAYTVDSRGRIVRAFYARPECQAVYARGFADGRLTCPIEAVDPLTIVAGQPAEPAHPKLLRLQQEARP